MKRRLLYIFAAAFVLYLVGSGFVAWYVESEYMHDLRQELTGLGKDYLKQPDKLRLKISEDANLQRLRGIMRLDLPFGMIDLSRAHVADDEIDCAARNLALPPAQRFADANRARRLGFDPSRRDDSAIVDELMSDLK